MNKNPLISIIIVNYNGRKWFKDCLDSLELQTYHNFEIIVVDNNSSDGSVKLLHDKYPNVIVVQSWENLWFAGWNNIGLKYSHGEYILLLNNDTLSEANLIEWLLAFAQKHPKLASVQPKMVLMNDKLHLDVAWSFWTSTGFLYHYGYMWVESQPEYNRELKVFSNKWACLLIPKKIIDEIWFLDEDFWCYYEETDWCHRAWLTGYECWYYPWVTVYHAGWGTSLTFANSYIQFHNFKNKILSFFKNFEAKSLLLFLPIYMLFTILISIAWFFQWQIWKAWSIYKGYWWNIVHLSDTLKKRKKIQLLRRIGDFEINIQVKRNPKWQYYFALFTGLHNYQKHEHQ